MGYHLKSLIFSDATKRTLHSDPIISIRRRMVAALDFQIAGAMAEINGEAYSIETERWLLTDHAARTKERIKVQRPLRKMWFRDSKGELLIELRFANRAVIINGKPSIVVGSVNNLVPTLETIRKAVIAGELDHTLKNIRVKPKRIKKRRLTKPGLSNEAKTMRNRSRHVK